MSWIQVSWLFTKGRTFNEKYNKTVASLELSGSAKMEAKEKLAEVR